MSNGAELSQTQLGLAMVVVKPFTTTATKTESPDGFTTVAEELSLHSLSHSKLKAAKSLAIVTRPGTGGMTDAPPYMPAGSGMQ
mmetsp:Transcript_5972/g.13151  ORF Transcript_5972/g.13151 Transcript_5972/m.13151 type:complete len:84 (-) Transcript_5972:761-1012(-)